MRAAEDKSSDYPYDAALNLKTLSDHSVTNITSSLNSRYINAICNAHSSKFGMCIAIL